MGVLPPYDAPKKRAATKTGDLLAANGGTPLSSRYHVRSTVTTGVPTSCHAARPSRSRILRKQGYKASRVQH